MARVNQIEDASFRIIFLPPKSEPVREAQATATTPSSTSCLRREFQLNTETRTVELRAVVPRSAKVRASAVDEQGLCLCFPPAESPPSVERFGVVGPRPGFQPSSTHST